MNRQEKAKVKLTSSEDGTETLYELNFCYDDYLTESRFAFLTKESDPKDGVILICDTTNNNTLIPSNLWTKEQKEAGERVRELLEQDKNEFNKHVCPVYIDNLDFRYSRFKKGLLKANNEPKEKEEPKKEKKEEKKPKKK